VNAAASSHDLERFRAAIIRRMGLQFDDAKLGFLNDIMQRRLHHLGQRSDIYLHDLERPSAEKELSVLAQELTVGETYFFRNIEQFRALADIVLPGRMNARRPHSTLRLLSAGCASGEEPYSIAMTAKETIPDPSWQVDIRGVDINPLLLQKARRGQYSSWVLRETPADMRQKWFRVEGRDLTLDRSICRAVQFTEANLTCDDHALWLAGHYDAIFCRNVLMYFSPEQMCATIERIAQSLAPGGFLFLGHAETLRGISDRFHLHHSHGTFYYSLKDGHELNGRPAVQIAPKPFAAAAPAVALDQAWYHAIAAASERVAALVPDKAAASGAAAPSPLSWNVAPAFDLLRRERFADALDHVRTRPSAAERDPDVLLLEATLLAHSGQLTAAEDCCLRLLLIDECNAGAHYVLALCREHGGKIERAIEHDRIASYLDPEFAMPPLHLGLLASRGGDREKARRALARALDLLKREDASRLLLFGGGFNREALMALCRSALKDNGGAA
jgi:chemotaxis protein methyltransferase CheR